MVKNNKSEQLGKESEDLKQICLEIYSHIGEGGQLEYESKDKGGYTPTLEGVAIL